MAVRERSSDTQAVKVLVIEDDADIQEMLSTLLTTSGYTPEIVGTGGAGLRQLEHDSTDLVLLDLGLPDMDGFDVCRQIREANGAALPIVMFTGSARPHGVVEGLGLGADDYITKPVEPDELLARMEALLRRRQAAGDTVSENGALRSMLTLAQQEASAARTMSVTEARLRREFLHNITTHLTSLYSVLEAEFRREPIGAGREALQRVLGRVRGVALVYQTSEALQEDPVRMDKVIQTISTALKSIYSPRKRLPLTIEGGELLLPPQCAAPLAMIVNELVTNSFKHAFPDQRFGRISVAHEIQEGRLVLRVTDDGVGFVMETARAGRGLPTVRELTQSIDGTAEWQSSGNGTTVTIAFPCPPQNITGDAIVAG